jgi:flagellar protein FlaG
MTTTVSTVAQSNISTSAPQQTQVKAEAPVEEALVKSAVPQIEPIQVDTQADRAVSMEDVQKAVEQLRAAVDKYTPSLNIGFDGELNKMIVRITDSETNELIRELPPEDVLDIARFLERNGVKAVGSDSLRGMLVDEYR